MSIPAPPAPAPAASGTAEPARVPASVVPELHSLSPSRASDFMTCPLLYRYRVLDRLPQRPSRAAARGTLVHAVLEELFDLPAGDRTHAQASAKLAPTWGRLLDDEPVLGELFAEALASGPTVTDLVVDGLADAVTPDAVTPDIAPGAGVEAFLVEAEDLLSRYFTLEDPSRLEPAEREIRVETTLDSGLQLRGIIDRLDIAPTGEIRVVDYKTGRAPSEVFEAKALFQMKFYALVVWRVRGVMPTLLQLIYLGGTGELLRYAPEERDLLATERKLTALWAAIERAYVSGDWRPSPSKLCAWCDYQAICPAFGGTPPPLPSVTPSAVPSVEDDAAAEG
jgi:putative RecB family exonuclease